MIGIPPQNAHSHPDHLASRSRIIDQLQPRLAARSVDIGLVVPFVVALVGYSVYGIGGAAYGTAFAIFGLAVLERLDQENRTRTD